MEYFFPEINYGHSGFEKFHIIYGGTTVFNSFRVIQRNKKPRVISPTTKFLLNKVKLKIKKTIKNNLVFGFKLYLSSYKPKKKKNEATKVNPNKSLGLRKFSKEFKKKNTL